MQLCASNMDLVCIQDALGQLKSLAPNSSVIPKLEQAINQVKIDIELSQRLPEAFDCLALNDLDCAQSILDRVRNIAPQDASVLSLQQKVTELITQTNNTNQAREDKIKQTLDKAKQCLDAKRYDCAIEHSQAVLLLEQNNPLAHSIQQKANYDQKQAAENQRKADKLLKKATACFSKKNYTCAIANSESALEFTPNYAPAKKLIQQSKQQLETLKNNFKIN